MIGNNVPKQTLNILRESLFFIKKKEEEKDREQKKKMRILGTT